VKVWLCRLDMNVLMHMDYPGSPGVFFMARELQGDWFVLRENDDGWTSVAVSGSGPIERMAVYVDGFTRDTTAF